MKVYLVWRTIYTRYSYDGTSEELVAIYDSEEKANKAIGNDKNLFLETITVK